MRGFRIYSGFFLLAWIFSSRFFVKSKIEPVGLPLVINTWAGNYAVATEEAWRLITQGRTSLDAVEAGITACELAQCGTNRVTVGFGGSPNEAAETTLDAMIFDGATHSVGAVGCLKRVKKAISVARAVMENTKSTLLVGEDDFPPPGTSSDLSWDGEMWKTWKKKNCQPNFWKETVSPNPRSSCGPYTVDKGKRTFKNAEHQSEEETDEDNHDTIGMLVIDEKGDIAAGTSTNGLSHKIPGRVGDSPIPGAGAYVDKDVGGAAGTGNGDVMLKFLPSFHAVELLRQGKSPTKAAKIALMKIARYHPTFRGALITVTKDGRYGAASHGWSYFRFTVRNPRTSRNKVIYIKPFRS